MIKYRIRKSKYHPEIVMAGYDYDIVNKNKLQQKLSEGWTFVEKEYFIISNLLREWKALTTSEKSLVISIISLIVSILVALFK
ncbi:hypothetical protein [Kaistella carnis]|uniref:Uncharacterized protein n=1 Tax=Kaistella carnis TaxID=1241979 RepID=A0A3G8XUR0_9FLAO|nr:hypothetical protein [Kaistella carnis]AZI33954.1 hypothetical protein EIB73_12490 [Kaistella carnis]